MRASIIIGVNGWWMSPFLLFLSFPLALETASVSFLKNISMAALMYPAQHLTFPFRNTASGHVKPRVAEEVKAHSYDALERNTTVSYFLCYDSFLINSQYQASGLKNVSFCSEVIGPNVLSSQHHFCSDKLSNPVFQVSILFFNVLLAKLLNFNFLLITGLWHQGTKPLIEVTKL